MKEVRNIQLLRGLAAISVLLYHLLRREAKAIGGRGISPGFFQYGRIGVDLFFVISGFIMVYIQPSPLGDIKSYARFMVHRLTRIYPPVWIVTIFLVPIYIVRPELFNGYYHHKVDLARSFLLLPQEYLPLLETAWSLIHEVYFYFVVSVALILRLERRFYFGAAWFLIVFTVICASGGSSFRGNRTLELIFSPFSLTFLLGYFIGLLYPRKIINVPGIGWVCIGLAVFGLMIGYHSVPDEVYPDNNSLSRFFHWGIPCALLVMGAVCLEDAMRKHFSSLRHLGNESYAIYLLHLPIMALIYRGVAAWQISSRPVLVGLALATLAICIAVASVFHRYIEMPVTRGARILLERRLGLSMKFPVRKLDPGAV